MKQTIKQRRALAKLRRLEAKADAAQAAYNRTKSSVWLARLKDLRTACLKAA